MTLHDLTVRERRNAPPVEETVEKFRNVASWSLQGRTLTLRRKGVLGRIPRTIRLPARTGPLSVRSAPQEAP